MSKANILIVEDESIVAKDIELSLKKLGYKVVGIASTGEKALDLVEKHMPDLILMDIMLKGNMSGIDVADRVHKDQQLPVIYLTAYADQATLNKAKVTEPYGYILKPFKEVDLQTTIEMTLYRHGKIAQIKKERDFLYSIVEGQQPEHDIMFVKSNSKLVKLRTGDITYIEALKDYVVINTHETRYTIHSTMKDIMSKLNENDFIRVHRSYIVRIDKIGSIEQPNIVLEKSRKLIPIGGSYKEPLLEKIKSF